jgi:hypothetical protein
LIAGICGSRPRNNGIPWSQYHLQLSISLMPGVIRRSGPDF